MGIDEMKHKKYFLKLSNSQLSCMHGSFIMVFYKIHFLKLYTDSRDAKDLVISAAVCSIGRDLSSRSDLSPGAQMT